MGSGIPGDEQERLTRRRLARILAGSASLPFLSACAALATDDRVLVKMTGRNQFAPSGITIPLGATVVWMNEGTGRHTATCDPELVAEPTNTALPPTAAPWSSGDLYPGQSWEQTFTVPGVYLYVCRYHELDGMLGTIDVVAEQNGTTVETP